MYRPKQTNPVDTVICLTSKKFLLFIHTSDLLLTFNFSHSLLQTLSAIELQMPCKVNNVYFDWSIDFFTINCTDGERSKIWSQPLFLPEVHLEYWMHHWYLGSEFICHKSMIYTDFLFWIAFLLINEPLALQIQGCCASCVLGSREVCAWRHLYIFADDILSLNFMMVDR